MDLVIPKLWNEIDNHINTDYDVTSWILCVIPHIRDNLLKISNVKHHFQVKNVIKTLYYGLTEKEFIETLDIFLSKYI